MSTATNDTLSTDELDVEFYNECDRLKISKTNQNHLKSLLAPLREKSSVTNFHYRHSLRVGLVASKIGNFIHKEEKPLLLAGALHDLGKCQTCLSILGKKDAWNDDDQKEIQNHVIDGYRLLRGRFDFTAEAMLWHHKFQGDGYPEVLPPFLHNYRQTTKLLIREYGRIVAIADVYDALHRVDSKFGSSVALTAPEIKEKMFELNPDRKKLIAALYKDGVLI